jgi:hypothetical protein
MTTRFDPATYGAFARDPACAGVQIDAAARPSRPSEKFGPRELQTTTSAPQGRPGSMRTMTSAK